MTGQSSSAPAGYHTVTPYLIVQDVAGLIKFLVTVFSAKETERLNDSQGRIMHAEVCIGDSVIMLGESNSPTLAALYIYLEDTDAAYRRALAAGATSLREPTNEFYGDRSAGVKDAFGNQWWLATRVEKVPAEEMQRRAEAQPPRPSQQ